MSFPRLPQADAGTWFIAFITAGIIMALFGSIICSPNAQSAPKPAKKVIKKQVKKQNKEFDPKYDLKEADINTIRIIV